MASLTNRPPSDGEIAMYHAYFAWYDAYVPSQLADINWLHLWRYAWAAAERHHQIEQTVPSHLPRVA